MLTKGDNNPVNDRSLYTNKQLYITNDMIVGKVHGIMPYGGYMTIVLNDYPMLKFLVLGGMLLSMLLTNDTNA